MNALTQNEDTSMFRAADQAYLVIENLIVTLALQPGAPIIEAELIAMTGFGRTPLREALLRMSSNGLVEQMPRRGLIVSDIDIHDHMSVIETRRALEELIVKSAARRGTPEHQKAAITHAEKMLEAANIGDLKGFMAADQSFDRVIHSACRNRSVVVAVTPLIIKCRRFWYAFQHKGDVITAAQCHLAVATAIAQSDEKSAIVAVNSLMDYLEAFVRQVGH